MAAKKKKSASKKKSSPAKARKPAPKAKKAKKAAPRVKAKAAPKAKAKKAAPKAKAKKVAPKAKAARQVSSVAAAPAKKKAAPAKAVTPRRDATGHLDPQYARDLRARSRESHDDVGEGRAFLRTSRSNDDLAEELGEEAVAAMTSGEDQSDRLEAEVEEELGGPFVITGREELARGTDKSNPRSATREPFPTT